MPDLTAILNWVSSLLQNISNFVQTSFGNLTQWLYSLVTGFTDWFANIAGTLYDYFERITQSLFNTINDFVQRIKTVLLQISDFLWGLVQPIIERVSAFLQSAVNYVSHLVNTALTYIADFARGVGQTVADAVKRIVDPVITWVADAFTNVKNGILAGVDAIKRFIDAVVAEVTQAIDAIIGASSALITAVNEKLVSIREGFLDAATELGGKISDIGEEVIGPLSESVKDFVRPFLEGFDPKSFEEARTALNDTLSPNTLKLMSRAEAQAWAFNLVPKSHLAKVLWIVILGFNLMSQVYGGIAQANGQVLLQEFAEHYHYQLLSPADATAAVFRGDLGRDEARKIIVKQGYAPEDADRLIDNASRVPEVGELLAMRLRELISPEAFQKAMVRLGFSQSFEKAYVELSQVIPPIGDLIHFAVKGAFSDEEVRTFGYDEGFPQDIVPFAEKQGLSDDWMKKYWRAHWQLPSATQGFEMLQRGEIGEEELKILLRALDYPPKWREKLINISYNVLTRVDVRRLHQLGLMNRAGLVKAHKNMGYSPTDAELLTEFVIELNKGKPGESDEELGKLSRSNIIGFYQDGVIPRERAIGLLVSAGFSNEAATLFVDTSDFDAERAERAAEIEFIISSAVAGVLEFGEAQDELGKLKLSPTEMDRAASKLLREQAKQTKLPTADDGAKMFKAKVINEATYRDLLRRLGYRSVWVDAFVALQKKAS